jgi:hypothetical protein
MLKVFQSEPANQSLETRLDLLKWSSEWKLRNRFGIQYKLSGAVSTVSRVANQGRLQCDADTN